MLLPRSVFAQDLSKTVLPITGLKWIGPGVKVDFGTGFCLDAECRFIATNYHVAMTAKPGRIKGQRIIHRYLATGPDDDSAAVNFGSALRTMKYTLSRDLAIFELRRPVPHYHGIPFSLNDLQRGQAVDIYAYPKESINPVRSLLRFHGAFKGETADGLLAFDYSPSNGKLICAGASGGLVVDSRSQQVVGILSAVAADAEHIALAVPVGSLADFVRRVQPWLAQSLFPTANREAVSPAPGDLYPKFVPPASRGGLQHRPEEPPEVRMLREKAQGLADSMRNFIAVQSFEWGSGQKGPSARAEYEVQVVDGIQRFRNLPEGREDLREVREPRLTNGWVVPAAEWSNLPKMVGSDFRLKVNHAVDVLVSGQNVKVFQYYASVEDNLCPFRPVEDYVFFTVGKTIAVACYGEVWTDADTNIVRMSEHLDLSDRLKAYRGWEEVQVVLTYGWLRRAGVPARRVPLTIYTEAGEKKHIYWCRGFFTDYRVFTSHAKVVASDYEQGLPHYR